MNYDEEVKEFLLYYMNIYTTIKKNIEVVLVLNQLSTYIVTEA